MDRCSQCDTFVDTDYDLDCYDTNVCVCEKCRDTKEPQPVVGYHNDYFARMKEFGLTEKDFG